VIERIGDAPVRRAIVSAIPGSTGLAHDRAQEIEPPAAIQDPQELERKGGGVLLQELDQDAVFLTGRDPGRGHDPSQLRKLYQHVAIDLLELG
jgi:hypothetical protein